MLVGLAFLLASIAANSAPPVVTVAPGTVQGAVKLHIEVGTDGRAHKCEVLQSSGNHNDDRRACTFSSKYAHPDIQRDAHGNPTEYDRTFWVDPSALKQLRNAGI